MSFQTPIPIKEAVENIHNRKYFLPSIQRELVWDTDRMELLFDSIMQGYPINSFLFWEVKHNNKKEYQFYEFIKDYVEDIVEHNPKANVDSVTGDFNAILDGQQRLTSFYIGLMGSYSERRYRARRGKMSSYDKEFLYLNLLAESEDENKKYDFRFLQPKEAEHIDEKTFWYKASNILEINDPNDINEFVYNGSIADPKTAFTILFKFYRAINETPVINFFLEKSESLDKVLNIFIRINSGGVELNYSDMLLSIATAQWKEKDAREEINFLYDTIKGEGFWNIKKDWILKACLYLTNIKDIKFKVDNFNNKNMLKIEEDWENIKGTLLRTMQLIKNFGYDEYNLSSYNALLPIAHYLHNFQTDTGFATNPKYKEKRKEIHKWFCNASLKRTFSGQPDTVLVRFRRAIQKQAEFDFNALKESVKNTSKNMTFNEEELEGLLDIEYGKKLTYPLLSLLYNNPEYDVKPDIDHIHPRGTIEHHDDWDYDYWWYPNTIVNLQLLHTTENIIKSDTPFDQWFANNYRTDEEKYDFKTRHLIPGCNLSPDHFDEFYNQRKKMLLERLKEILN